MTEELDFSTVLILALVLIFVQQLLVLVIHTNLLIIRLQVCTYTARLGLRVSSTLASCHLYVAMTPRVGYRGRLNPI